MGDQKQLLAMMAGRCLFFCTAQNKFPSLLGLFRLGRTWAAEIKSALKTRTFVAAYPAYIIWMLPHVQYNSEAMNCGVS